jgi:hypothetical protein
MLEFVKQHWWVCLLGLGAIVRFGSIFIFNKDPFRAAESSDTRPNQTSG